MLTPEATSTGNPANQPYHMQDILTFAHTLLRGALRPGDRAVDATVGNGHDTVFLTECVGPRGHVAGFDVQQEALRRTAERLASSPARAQVTLMRQSHAQMRQALGPLWHQATRAISFNLGYLPGGDKSVTTQSDSTCAALGEGLSLLTPGGVMTIVCYTGHPAGAEEAAAVERWGHAVDQQEADVLSYRFINQANDPPRLLAVKKKETRDERSASGDISLEKLAQRR